MATPALIRAALPGESELQSFARAAAHLLVERQPRSGGSRAVARRAGIGLQHFDHRDYAPGDEVRHIDWRHTARSRRPIVRRFELESVTDWTLVLDASSSMTVDGAAKWRSAVQAAAALAYALLHLGHRVGMLAFGSRVLAECARGRGQHHYATIARQLTTLRPSPAGERSELGACAPRLHGDGSVVVIGDFLGDDEMRHDLGRLLQRCTALHVLQVGDAAETRLRLAGEFDLVDVETGARLPVRAGGQVDALATLERAAMTGRLRGFCARSGVSFTAWDIALPWQHMLLRHLIQARGN